MSSATATPPNTAPRAALIGLWHLGLVTAAGLLRLGYEVRISDPDPAVVAAVERGELPLDEPGLGDALGAGIDDGSLTLHREPTAAAAGVPLVWLVIDVPLADDGIGVPDVVARALDAVLDGVDAGALVAISSQLPVGTTRALAARASERGREDVTIAYVPENLRLGRGIERFAAPDMFVVGADDHASTGPLQDLAARVDRPPMLVGLETAEMVKHAINAFLATSVSLANELGDLCEAVGGDGHAVAAAMRADGRIGSAARVRPGLGYSGGTLERDVRYLHEAGARHDVATPVLRAVSSANRARPDAVLNALGRHLDLAHATIAVLGLTYTSLTSTLRRSGPLEIAELLARKGAHMRVFDARAEDLPAGSWARRCATAAEALDGADAVLLLNDDAGGSDVDAGLLAGHLSGRLVCDAFGLLDDDDAREHGLSLLRPGVPGVACASV